MLSIKKCFVVLVLMVVCVNVHAQIKIGQQAPEISLPNVHDSIISLSSFKGKVVLIDFWASWCGPCRASIPSVKKIYNAYKDKGLVVLGVSIDNKKQAWLDAIDQLGINYIQVNDAGGWDAATTEKYNVEQIPSTFLLNKQGKVIAIDAEGKQLKRKIEKLLSQL